MNLRSHAKSAAAVTVGIFLSFPLAGQSVSQIQNLTTAKGLANAASTAVTNAINTAKAGAKTEASNAAKSATGGLIDINTVGRAKLMTLPGIGAALCQKILRGRPYRSITDLSPVIGNTAYARIASLIVAGQISKAMAKPPAK